MDTTFESVLSAPPFPLSGAGNGSKREGVYEWAVIRRKETGIEGSMSCSTPFGTWDGRETTNSVLWWRAELYVGLCLGKGVGEEYVPFIDDLEMEVVLWIWRMWRVFANYRWRDVNKGVFLSVYLFWSNGRLWLCGSAVGCGSVQWFVCYWQIAIPNNGENVDTEMLYVMRL